MDELKERYGIFGPAVLEQIRLELNRVGNLRELLVRLDAQPPDDLEQQHAALYALLGRYGPLFFMTVAKSDWTPDQVKKMKKNLKTGVDTPKPGSGKRLTPESVRSEAGSRLALRETEAFQNEEHALAPRPSPVGVAKPQPSNVVHMRSPYTAPSKDGSRAADGTAGGGSTNGSSLVGPRGYIDFPTYKGPDRRLKAERRVGPIDRRAGLEVVYKNSRFGGKNRRKAIRRAADRNNGSFH